MTNSVKKKTFKLLNDGRKRTVANDVTGDKMLRLCFPTSQESKSWIFEGDPNTTMVKTH